MSPLRRKLRHLLSRDDFHLANFTTRLWLAIQIDVAANRVLDVFERLFDVSASRMTPGQFRTTN
jgi:head-tail adaptor